MKKKQKFPAGWDENRVREVLAHYENQGEDEQFAEIEVARETESITLMAVPTELVPKVRALLARDPSAGVVKQPNNPLYDLLAGRGFGEVVDGSGDAVQKR